MDPSLIIIGGGVAGLTAGCYAAMNGYQVKILEMSGGPGGLCTSWRRNGYTFDGSVAGLAGSSPGSPLYRLWQEIGVIRYCPLEVHDDFGTVMLPDGRKITIYTNIDRLEAHLKLHFPDERGIITEFATALRAVLDLNIPFSDARGWEAVKVKIKSITTSIAHLPVLTKYGSVTIRQFVSRIKDPALATVFNNIVHFGGPDVPLLTVLLPLAYAHRKMAGIPTYGWLSFAKSIERRFTELGGTIQYQEKVVSLIIEDSAVKGVITESGAKYFANRVLSAADGRFSESMLLGRPEGEMRQSFDPNALTDQPVQVNLGVAEDFSDNKGSATYILPESIQAAGREHQRITVHYKFSDHDAAPRGKSALTVFLDSDYAFWRELVADPIRYKEEKDRCSEMVIGILERYFPDIRDKVDVIDVSTPITRERFTGNWMGAMQARKPNSNMIKALMAGKPRYTYKGIDGFYMAGQWVEAWGGITTAAQSGRKAIQCMCKNDGKQFGTTIV